MDSFWQDIRYSLRSLARQPFLVLVAVVSLALGIGVNTAIFSVMNALVLRPMPVRNPDRTVFVFHSTPDNPDRGTSFPAFEHYRSRSDIFSRVMAFAGARPLFLIDGERRDQVYAELVTADYFSIVDVGMRLGRPFNGEEDRASNPQFVAVLSHAFWQRRYASDPAIVGKTVVLNGRPFMVTGIAAAGFSGLDVEASTDMWMPMTTWAHVMSEPGRLTSDEHWMRTVAELSENVGLEQAQAAMESVSQG